LDGNTTHWLSTSIKPNVAFGSFATDAVDLAYRLMSASLPKTDMLLRRNEMT
jgi:hypothetical protein